MTSPRKTPTVTMLLALGLAAIVALPAATAVQLASAGSLASDAAWKQGGTMGGGGASCLSTSCARSGLGGDLVNQGGASAGTAWSFETETHERAALDAALAAAKELKAEADAKAREALAAKERVRADLDVRHDLRTEGDAQAAWDNRADVRGDAGFDGLVTLGGERRVDLEREERLQHEAQVQAKAQADNALDALAQLLAELQGQVEVGVGAAVDAAADAGSAVGQALGLVERTQVDLHHDLDLQADLGAVPTVAVPRLQPPRAGLDGSADVAAEAYAAAKGLVRN